MPIFPNKLKPGDTIQVIAPSQSLGIISAPNRKYASARLEKLGLKITFGKHVEEIDQFRSSSIKSRVADLHAAFKNKNVKAIFTVIGGFNCNQMLDYIDWDIIKKNPKIFIGYSDTTALQNAMLQKANLVTYSGPAYSTFGQHKYFDYTLENFVACVFENKSIKIKPAKTWSDDLWYIDQEKRKVHKNEGYWILNPGKARGTIIGGNLSTLLLLQGTPYFPKLKEAILFLEDDEDSHFVHFERQFQALLHGQPNLKILGIVIGRFQVKSQATRQQLASMISVHPRLRHVPVIANADFGHTSPIFTFPIGGMARIVCDKNKASIEIVKH